MRAPGSSLLLVLLAACGSKQPLAGHWRQQLPAGSIGLELWFGPQDAVGGCNHQPDDDDLDGKYSFAEGKLTITARWQHSGKLFARSGSLVGELLELTGADGKTTFRRGDGPRDH